MGFVVGGKGRGEGRGEGEKKKKGEGERRKEKGESRRCNLAFGIQMKELTGFDDFFNGKYFLSKKTPKMKRKESKNDDIKSLINPFFFFKNIIV